LICIQTDTGIRCTIDPNEKCIRYGNNIKCKVEDPQKQIKDNIKKISDAIDECWDKKSFAGIANKSNCSGLVKCVGSEINITLTGNANDIIDYITNEWNAIDDGAKAKEKANMGKFVIAGYKNEPNGHVVIVIPGTLARDKYPTAAWGKYHSIGEKKETLNWAFLKSQRDCLTYRYKDLP
jgi:hypothetical protein